MAYEVDGIKQVEYEELKEMIDKKEASRVIIDVREPGEYEQAHIPSIPLIPMQSIPNSVDELDKSKEYIFVCRSGSRSHNVALFLKQQGFEHVHNYAGGMLAWEGETKSGLENVVKDASTLFKE